MHSKQCSKQEIVSMQGRKEPISSIATQHGYVSCLFLVTFSTLK